MRCRCALARTLRAFAFTLAFAAFAFCATGTFAQTAHFSYAAVSMPGSFSGPTSVAVDRSGNIYVVNSASSPTDGIPAVREVPVGCTSPACVTTLGGGFSGPQGVAVDTSGNVYVADTNNNAVKEMPSGCASSACVTALGGGFSKPIAVAVDSGGNVYAAEYSAVKEIPAGCASSACVTMLGGGFQVAGGVAVDGKGDVYVTDFTYGASEMSPGCASSACVTKLVGGFTAVGGIAVDPSGNVYVTKGSKGIAEIPFGCSSLACITALVPASAESAGVAVDESGNFYATFVNTNSNYNNVKEFIRNGVNFLSRPVGSISAATDLKFTFDSAGTIQAPAVLTQGAAGLDFIDAGTGTCTTNGVSHSYAAGDTCTVNVEFSPRYAGARYGAVILKNPSGAPIANAYIYGTGIGAQAAFSPPTQSTAASGLYLPYGVAVDGSGNLYIANFDGNSVLKETLQSNGSYTQSTIASGLNYPGGVAVDGSGNLYIANMQGGSNGMGDILKETLSGGSYTQSTIPATGLDDPTGVAVDGSGNLYIVNYGGGVLKETLSGGSYTQSTIPATGLDNPFAMAVDGRGNVYIANTFADSVLKETLQSDGSYTQSTILATGLCQPSGVAVDGTGNVYIANTYCDSVLKETPQPDGSYTQSTIVATGLRDPEGLVVDAKGAVYIANGFQGSMSMGAGDVLKEDFADPPTLTFAATIFGKKSSDSPRTVTIQNIGNAALAFPLPSTGHNPSVSTSFEWDGSSTCDQTDPSSPKTFSLAAGASCDIAVDFAPTTTGSISGSVVLTDNSLNAAAAEQTIALSGTGTHATPIITWANPANIVYGTALSATQLDATASVPGTFVYSPAAGTVLTYGAQTLTTTFTPTDTTDYKTATRSVTLLVYKATPAITWPTPAPIPYGTPLSATQLDATANVPGTFSYSPATGTVLGWGEHTLTATFTPTNTTDYKTATKSVSLMVYKATPVIDWATPASITYGTPLSATQLDAKSPVAGTFSYSPVAGTVLAYGVQTLTATFTPTDTTDYKTATRSVTLLVYKATPVITWPTPAPIPYGTPLSPTQLNATANVPGTFSYSPAAGTVLGWGVHTLTASFTPTNTTDYKTATKSVSIMVYKATPVIDWATPASITYGTPLSATQLDAKSPVAGTFSYSPVAGTVLAYGVQTLTATFTPTDTTDYKTATGSVTLLVYRATPTITWPTPAPIAAGTALSSTQLDATITGVDGKALAGTATYSPKAGTVLSAGTHTLTVNFTPTDSTDYKSGTKSVTITVQ